MKPTIIFITTVYRTGEKVYPIIPLLTEHFNVDILNMHQMSCETPWIGKDPRLEFYDSCRDIGCWVSHGPVYLEDRDKRASLVKEFIKTWPKTLNKNYKLAIIDNNITMKGCCTSEVYEFFHSTGTPVVACPHGNREYNRYPILKHIEGHYDYSFVFGEKEKRELTNRDNKRSILKDKLLCGGIPCNDILKDYPKKSKYLLIIPNMTDPKHIYGPVKGFHAFTRELFDELELIKFAKKEKCNIIIKEKNKLYSRSTLLQDSFRNLKKVEVIQDCKDDNKLIADAKMVISAPSTMAFKSIQIGIPTVLLKGHGMVGNFGGFKGLVKPEKKVVWKAMDQQRESGRDKEFISDTLTGGLDFSSSQIYIKKILELTGEF